MKEKEKKQLALDLLTLATLILALGALIYTWGNQANMEAEIRTEYQEYIEACQAHQPNYNITIPNGGDPYDYTPTH